ncbi:acyltransferase family protein [Porticoccus sp. GXU_MW_L64]
MKIAEFHKVPGGLEITSKVGYLDGWRGVAITFVLVSHFTQFPFVNFGRLGVDIFFVLSGLLMANILFVKKTPLGIFYKRRFSRIVPIFFIFVTTVYVASAINNSSLEHKNIIYTLTFLRTYLPTQPGIWDTELPIGHLWSLHVEEHCYILLSLVTLIRFFRGKEYLLLGALGLVSTSLHAIYIKFPELSDGSYITNSEITASHLLLSSAYFLFLKKNQITVHPFIPILTFLLAVLCYTKMTPWYSSWLFSPFLLAFTVNHLNFLPKIGIHILSNPILKKLGIWSFSIYLWQQPFYQYCIKGASIDFLTSLGWLLLAIITGVFSFYTVENPVRNFLNKKWTN